MKVTTYTNKHSVWINAAGDAVPYKFVPQIDKDKEKLAAKLLSSALKAEETLQLLHTAMNEATQHVVQATRQEYAIKSGKEKAQGKGAITWYNFDRSIKIEADVNDIVKWDEALMTEALKLLNDYVNSNLTEGQELIKGMVTDGFSNSKGMIDSRRIFQLLKYETKIKHKGFLKACELIKQAQNVDTTKLYMRIWVKEQDGSYRNVNLNFSSI